jgi:hypothetical protein
MLLCHLGHLQNLKLREEITDLYQGYSLLLGTASYLDHCIFDNLLEKGSRLQDLTKDVLEVCLELGLRNIFLVLELSQRSVKEVHDSLGK